MRWSRWRSTGAMWWWSPSAGRSPPPSRTPGPATGRGGGCRVPGPASRLVFPFVVPLGALARRDVCARTNLNARRRGCRGGSGLQHPAICAGSSSLSKFQTLFDWTILDGKWGWRLYNRLKYPRSRLLISPPSQCPSGRRSIVGFVSSRSWLPFERKRRCHLRAFQQCDVCRAHIFPPHIRFLQRSYTCGITCCVLVDDIFLETPTEHESAACMYNCTLSRIRFGDLRDASSSKWWHDCAGVAPPVASSDNGTPISSTLRASLPATALPTIYVVQ